MPDALQFLIRLGFIQYFIGFFWALGVGSAYLCIHKALHKATSDQFRKDTHV